jgi:hypothetical protein
LQATTTTNTSTSLERNKQILERFLQSIKSEVTQVNVIDYIHAYMRYWRLYEEEEEEEEPLIDEWKRKKKIVYRYDWLLDDDATRQRRQMIQAPM